MSYTIFQWSEVGYSEADAITHLNHIETIYDEAVSSIVAMLHDSSYYLKTECDGLYFGASNDGPASGLVAYTLDGMTAADILNEATPEGSIALWAGSVLSIPTGWVLCDGSNGTPDLRSIMVIGAGDSYNYGEAGGYNSITPTGTVTITETSLTSAMIPAHDHGWTDTYNNTSGGYPGAGYASIWNSGINSHYTEYAGSGAPHGHTGSSANLDEVDNRPPYYALCYIMRVAA